MKYIEKQTPPASFVRYALRRDASFDDLSENYHDIKQELRTALAKEQGYICCYCGCRINDTNAIIEHLLPQQKHPKLQLNYMNLLASCDGGQTARRNERVYPSCCDDCKKNRELGLHPLIEDCESRFIFDDDGDIICAPDDLEATQAIEILNLKSPVLKHRRKAAIEAYKYFQKEWDWEGELYKLEHQVEGKYIEFCFVIKSYLLNFKLA